MALFAARETPTAPILLYELRHSEWAHPTGTFSLYTYTGGGYPSGDYSDEPYPEATARSGSAASVNSGSGMPRNANYFFGFLITFIILLLLFVACGIGRRRRMAAMRSRERMEGLSRSGPGPATIITFGGLLGSSRVDAREARRLANEEMLKQKPIFHEVFLDRSDGKQTSTKSGILSPAYQRNLPWSGLEPLSASVVRPPRDLAPYQQFQDVLASTSSNRRYDRHHSQASASSSILPAVSTRYRDSLPPPYEPTDSGSWPQLDTQHSNVELPSSSEKMHRSAPGGNTEQSESQNSVEVAVMVAMPQELDPTNTLNDTRLPDCQIGVATIPLVEARPA